MLHPRRASSGREETSESAKRIAFPIVSSSCIALLQLKTPRACAADPRLAQIKSRAERGFLELSQHSRCRGIYLLGGVVVVFGAAGLAGAFVGFGAAGVVAGAGTPD